MANVRSEDDGLHLRWQPTLLGALDDTPAFDPTFSSARRVALDDSAWVEHVEAWVRGTEALFAEVVGNAPWEHRRVRMYDRMVDEPRLTAWYGTALHDVHAPPILADMIAALGARYDRAFDSVGAALYRDGRDSVAWHGDRVDPTLVEPIVAIVSLGSARTLGMRPRWRRGAATRFRLAPGDLFVMGGSTQSTWQHSVPKVKNAGARVSVQFRHSTERVDPAS